MKNTLIQKIFLLIILSLSLACTKNFDEINSNPNAPEKVPLTNLLLSAISNGFNESLTIYDTEFGGSGPTTSGLWVQHFSENGIGYRYDEYVYSPPTFEVYWRKAYQGPLQDIQAILADPEAGPNMHAAAIVIRAYLISSLTDLFGDIPFSQACQIASFPQPTYDTQDSIYHSLTNQLKQAAQSFDNSSVGDLLGRGDVLYYGDIIKWKKFANSLRAKLLNRYKHKDSQANQDLNKLLIDPVSFPVFENNVDNAAIIPVGSLPYISPFFQWNILQPNYMRPSSTLVDILKNLNDPRLLTWIVPNQNGDYVGMINGSGLDPNGSPPLNAVCSFSNKLLLDPKLPMTAMSYAELLFIRAEVFDDHQAYLDGISAAMKMYDTSPTSQSMTLADSAWQKNHLEAIATQRWLVLLLNENEAFTEYRRTGFPSAIHEIAHSKFKGKGIPYRYGYPPIEGPTNGANLQAAQNRQNIKAGLDIFGDKMWWAK